MLYRHFADRADLDRAIQAEIVGAARAAVRRWVSRPGPVPAPDVFIDLVTQSIWLQVAGMAAARGAAIDPDRPVQELFGAEAG